MKKIILLTLLGLFFGCKPSGLAILNKNDQAIAPPVKENVFVLTQKATDKKYGYSESLPVNLGFTNSIHQVKPEQYLKALSGPNQEEISYKFIESCCPFITKKGDMGTGLLDKYEISWAGLKKPLYIYINIYEKGDILIPYNLNAKK